jgi:hypothetical protein
VSLQALCDGVATAITGVTPAITGVEPTITGVDPVITGVAPVKPTLLPSRRFRWNRRWASGAILAIVMVLGFGIYLVIPMLQKEKTTSSTSMLDYTSQMSPVRDSGSEGNAVGFAVAAALEYQIQKAFGKKVIVSPRYIYYYARQKGGFNTDKDTGAHLRDSIDVLLNRGAVLEEEWPYKAGEFAAKPPPNVQGAEHYKVSKAHPIRTVNELKLALQQFGPVVGGISYPASVTQTDVTRTGIIPLPNPGESILGGDAVCFVGFDDIKKLLKFQSHWGTGWGDNGYGYISYEYADKFLIDAWAMSINKGAVAIWFGAVTGGIAAVAGSQADKSGSDDGTTESGAFSFRFQRALQDPRADVNQDGQITVAEAAIFTKNALIRDGFDQVPTVAGQAAEISLFSTHKPKPGTEKYRTVYAVVVGINNYRQEGANLRGPVNDAKGFTKLLGSKELALFGTSNVTTLIDEQATAINIERAIDVLRQKATKDDLVVFFFSGHITTVGKEPDVSKVIFPTDGDVQKGHYLKISDIVESIKKVGAKNALVVVDG